MLSCSVGARSLSRFDFTVIGDSVNTAARLQNAAREWQILASRATCTLAGDGILYGDPQTFSVKGKANELVAMLVLGISETVPSSDV